MAWHDGIEAGSPAYEIASSQNQYVRVVAGPGTGKSFAMKRRVARLLESGVRPTRILPVTFTRVAAEDLHRELVGMNVPGCESLSGTTLHSLALRKLMHNRVLQATGRVPRPLNVFEMKPLEHDLAGQFGGIRETRKKIKAYESAWARLQRDTPGFVQSQEDAAFEQALVSWLRFHGAMLIGEVIPQFYEYLRSNPDAPERSEYSHILVDEYQDLNKAEQAVIALLSDAAEVCIVGDDDQSIYSFKHAHPEGIRVWLDEHDQADDLGLDDCRRCPSIVVEMANSLISINQNRPVPRELVPMPANGEGDVRIIQYATLDDEVAGIVELVSQLVDEGIHPGNILILAQRSVVGTPIFEGLKAREIPVDSYYSESELDHEDTQKRFALLKLFVKRDDRVALRWLLGLGSNTWLSNGYRRIMEHCMASEDTPWETFAQLESGDLSIPYTNPIRDRFSQIRGEIAELTELQDQENFSAVVDHIFPDNLDNVSDIRAIAMGILEEDENTSPPAFLRILTTAIAAPEVPTEIEEVRVMSLHKSKGLSAPVTIVAGCVEGLLPKEPDANLPQAVRDASIEEQRRLFFVGITRVKAVPAEDLPGTLILTSSRSMPFAAAKKAGISPVGNQYNRAQLITSRFIAELGPHAPDPVAG